MAGVSLFRSSIAALGKFSDMLSSSPVGPRLPNEPLKKPSSPASEPCVAPQGMLLRHDNGLVFGSRRYRAVVTDYGLTQEYITPYTPQQNGLCERFIKTFKEEFAWTRNFKSIEHARFALRVWLHSYNTQRPHQAPNFKTPNQHNQSQCKAA